MVGLEEKKSLSACMGIRFWLGERRYWTGEEGKLGIRIRIRTKKRKGSAKRKNCPSSATRRRYPRAIVRKRRIECTLFF